MSLSACLGWECQPTSLETSITRLALSGGMDSQDWRRMEWPFKYSRVREASFRGSILQENPCDSAGRAVFVRVQAPNFQDSPPEKLQFFTPSHSTPPLEFLLITFQQTQKAAPVQEQQLQLKQISDAASLWRLCCHASVPTVQKLLQMWHLALPEMKAEIVIVTLLMFP